MAHLPTIIPASQARSNFYDLIDEVATTSKKFIITRRGRAQAVVLSPEEVESWEETLEIMSNKKLMRDIEKGLEDIKKGRVIPWEAVKAKLDLSNKKPRKNG